MLFFPKAQETPVGLEVTEFVDGLSLMGSFFKMMRAFIHDPHEVLQMFFGQKQPLRT
jgi:hypothetical protein